MVFVHEVLERIAALEGMPTWSKRGAYGLITNDLTFALEEKGVLKAWPALMEQLLQCAEKTRRQQQQQKKSPQQSPMPAPVQQLLLCWSELQHACKLVVNTPFSTGEGMFRVGYAMLPLIQRCVAHQAQLYGSTAATWTEQQAGSTAAVSSTTDGALCRAAAAAPDYQQEDPQDCQFWAEASPLAAAKRQIWIASHCQPGLTAAQRGALGNIVNSPAAAEAAIQQLAACYWDALSWMKEKAAAAGDREPSDTLRSSSHAQKPLQGLSYVPAFSSSTLNQLWPSGAASSSCQVGDLL